MITHYFIRSCIGTALLVSTLSASQDAYGDERPATDRPTASREESERPVRTISPGRVTFRLGTDGSCRGFGPSEMDAADWPVRRGGVVVLAVDGDKTIELLNTLRGNATVIERTSRLESAKEGVPGGTRYPSGRPDDDGDGRVDEDRLDGIDNDGDGRVDEDFAAVGDKMIVSACEGRVGDRLAVEVYQENFGWSLRHIDGMVATRLVITNRGKEKIEGLRVGNLLEFGNHHEMRAGSDLSDVSRRDSTAKLAAKAVAFFRGDEGSVAMLLFVPSGATSDDAWITGTAGSPTHMESIVANTRKGTQDGSTRGGGLSRGSIGFVISPDLGNLGPGEELVIYTALVDVSAGGRTSERAVDCAYRTIVGDGTHHVIPPPMEMKRHLVSGTYAIARRPDGEERFGVTLSSSRNNGVEPREIVNMGQLDTGAATLFETPSGSVHFEWAGDLPADIPRGEGRRIRLRGRLRNGEVFDAILEPVTLGRAGITAEEYFNTPGKIDEALISGSPNPFRNETTIHYEIPGVVVDEAGNELQLAGPINASVKIYNVAGRLIATLADDLHNAGRYSETWNATNDAGRSIASGVYYVKLQLGRRHVTKRLLQLK